MTQDIDVHENRCLRERTAARCGSCRWWIARVGCCCAISPLRSRDPDLVCAEFKPAAGQDQLSDLGLDSSYPASACPSKGR